MWPCILCLLSVKFRTSEILLLSSEVASPASSLASLCDICFTKISTISHMATDQAELGIRIVLPYISLNSLDQ